MSSPSAAGIAPRSSSARGARKSILFDRTAGAGATSDAAWTVRGRRFRTGRRRPADAAETVLRGRIQSPVVRLPRPVRTLSLSRPVRTALEGQIAGEHPREAGGYLACERRGERLVATEAVPVANDAVDPRRSFETVVDERAPGRPRVFYHSHTLPSSPPGLTATDRRQIPERYALVAFAPRGEVLDYRAFKRGLARWRDLSVDLSPADAGTPVPDVPADLL